VLFSQAKLVETTSMKPVTTFAGLIFLVVGIVHVWRALTGAVTVIVLGTTIPVWVSWPAFAISFLLAILLLWEARAA
jgi:hypothetical protein